MPVTLGKIELAMELRVQKITENGTSGTKEHRGPALQPLLAGVLAVFHFSALGADKYNPP